MPTEVTTTQGDVELTYNVDFGENLDDSVAKFGAEKVYDHFIRNAKIALQGMIGRMMKAGKPRAEIDEAVAAFKLESRKPGKSKKDKILDLLADMSDEDKAEVLKKWKGAK